MANSIWTATPHLTVSTPAADSTSSRSSIRHCNLSLTRTHSPSVVRNGSSSRRVGIYCSSDGGGGPEQTETTGIQLYRDIERLDLILYTIMLWCLINYNIRFWWLWFEREVIWWRLSFFSQWRHCSEIVELRNVREFEKIEVENTR